MHSKSFEVQCVALQSSSSALLCALIYRPPNSDSNFISDFFEFLTSVVLLYDRMLLLGDFNVHVCCPGRSLVSEFCNVLDSFGFTQYMINQHMSAVIHLTLLCHMGSL